jgi:hypothetical protein
MRESAGDWGVSVKRETLEPVDEEGGRKGGGSARHRSHVRPSLVQAVERDTSVVMPTRRQSQVQRDSMALDAPDLPSMARTSITRRDVLQVTGIQWAKEILEDRGRRHALCKAEFSADDVDQSGALNRDEVFSCVTRMCDRFEVKLPAARRCRELFDVVDKSGTGTLDLAEFMTFFKVGDPHEPYF